MLKMNEKKLIRKQRTDCATIKEIYPIQHSSPPKLSEDLLSDWNGKKKNGPAPTFLLIFKNTTFVEYTAISILMRLSQSESRKQKLFLFGFTHLFSFYFLIIQAPLFASAHQPTAELKGNRNTDDL